MTEQLNLLNSATEEGGIIPTALHLEMQQSYLEYAMSVIVGRALPDVRDGLKPVHRRILYAMQELGLLPDRPFRKCARVVGDVLGKYHPHGDQSVYDALVRLVQDFSSRYPLLAGHGNFGSIDNDPPAAMRYTECRLAPLGYHALLQDVNEQIVDFTDNFDGSQREPTVLPARLPIVLLNGATGIAVGMATNIPPHNLGEVVDGLIALIDDPQLPDEQLFDLIPAPDFPTGGIIVADGNLQELYRSGRGSFTLRGVATVEEISLSKTRKRTAIVVTELPFQVHKSAWIEKVAELVNQGKLEGIVDIRDESDRAGMRVVLELRKEVNPEEIIDQLYRTTTLQINFGAILLVLVNRRPCQLSLRQLLQEFLQFREQTLTRRYRYELDQCRAKLHITEGLLLALQAIDAVIATIRDAAEITSARAQLERQFNLTPTQAEAILAMPLRRLTNLEQQKLQEERANLVTEIQRLEHLLNHRSALLESLKQELQALKAEFGDSRRTRIVSKSDLALAVAAPPPAPTDRKVILEFTYRGYVRKWDGIPPTRSDDPPITKIVTANDRELLLFDSTGVAFPLPVAEIPPMPRTRSKGTPLLPLLPAKVEKIVSVILPEVHPIGLVTAQGRAKRLEAQEFADITSRGLLAIKLKENDRLLWAGYLPPGTDLVIATAKGRMTRLPVQDDFIPLQTRSALGNPCFKLKPDEILMGCIAVGETDRVLLVTAQGYGKVLQRGQIRVATKGSLGVQGMGFKSSDDYLAVLATITSDCQEVTLLLNPGERLVTVPLPVENGSPQGVPLLELAAGERVIAIVLP
ncbi:MAG: DNA topoisomerase (ATP-hydrolyzing) [Pseudanabaenaceae cyanobacterium SKYGB_i_bin29]|nr:DNA topoisomerase 4 subunit A [Pseudanabaenaceae cyanobacterium SKYG29]MDW8421357.1 DNA topoisomerase (ATP-hydrolyzing) [Pseudanabaenaceae cyanobacterium SKYGB_i_bin29]